MKLAALAAAGLALLGLGSAGASSTCRNGRILFVAQKQLHRPPAIYVVPFAGGTPVRVAAGAQLPAWSPRGDRLAYVRGRTLVVGAPRSAGHALVRVGKRESIVSVVWAPVGDALAYTVGDERGHRSLWVAHLQGKPRRLVGLRTSVDFERPSWSPDGRELVVSHTARSADGVLRSSLQIVDAATAHVRSVPNSTGAVAPQWSPDGTQIAFSSGFTYGLQVIAPDGSGRRSIGGPITGIVWSPDGTRVMGYDQEEERTAVVMVADGTEHTIGEYFNAAGWDPSSRWLVGRSYEGLAAIDPATDELRTIVSDGWTLSVSDGAAVLADGRIVFTATYHPYGDVSLFTAPALGGKATPLGHLLGDHPAWSPSGRAVAYDMDGRVYVAEATGANRRFVAAGSDPAWSPDGQKLALTRAGRTVVVPVAGGPEQDVGGGGEPTWSPDGTQIAVAAGNEIAVYPAAGGAARVLTHVTVQGTCPEVGLWTADAPAWSPDGRTIAFGLHYVNCWVRGLDEIAVVDVASGNTHEIAAPLGVSEGYFSPAWSPDGTTLAAAYLPENSPQRIIRLDGESTVWAGATDADSPTWQPVCS
jgi:Tol biopolymer transport system component